jgi:hypothetical protein
MKRALLTSVGLVLGAFVGLASCGGSGSPSGGAGGDAGSGGAAGAGAAASGTAGSGTAGEVAQAQAGEAGASPGGFLPDYVSGSRLRARYWTTDDGTRQFSTWYDSELDTPCLFSPAEDGVMRCLPSTQIAVQNSNAFSDSGCSKRYAAANPAYCHDSKYAVAATGMGQAVYLLGAVEALTSWYDASQGCAAIPVGPGEVDYELGRKLDPGELVAARSVTVPSGYRLQEVTLKADDGASQRTGWYDSTLGTTCNVDLAADGKRRCLPTANADINSLFIDDKCLTPAAIVYSSNGQTPPTNARSIEGTCEVRSHIFSLGAPLSGSFYASDGMGGCTPTTLHTGESAYTVGKEVDPTTLDEFEPAPQGAGRLQVAASQDADGALDLTLGADIIFDTMRMESCSFSQTDDGEAHCVPSAMQEFYTDMQCGAGIGVAEMQDCGPAFEFYISRWSGDVCTGGLALTSIGEPLAKPLSLYTSLGSECDPVSTSATLAFALGSAVDPSVFASATLTTE